MNYFLYYGIPIALFSLLFIGVVCVFIYSIGSTRKFAREFKIMRQINARTKLQYRLPRWETLDGIPDASSHLPGSKFDELANVMTLEPYETFKKGYTL